MTTSRDRKSTRLNSSHSSISYAVFCFCAAHRYLPSFLHDALPISSAVSLVFDGSISDAIGSHGPGLIDRDLDDRRGPNLALDFNARHGAWRYLVGNECGLLNDDLAAIRGLALDLGAVVADHLELTHRAIVALQIHGPHLDWGGRNGAVGIEVEVGRLFVQGGVCHRL